MHDIVFRKMLLIAPFIIARILNQGYINKYTTREFYNDIDLYLLAWNVGDIF